MIQKKICMIGGFAVGKTSLVQRFVSSIFSEAYHTTVGVKVDRKRVQVDGRTLHLLIWDLQGEDGTQALPVSYIKGAGGYLLVADGTRIDTLDTAYRLQAKVEKILGSVPFVLLVNKKDLVDQWALEGAARSALAGKKWDWVATSAKTGEGVEKAFELLARKILEKSFTDDARPEG